MDVYKDWTWDPVNYPVATVANFTQTLHDQHQQYVVIVDPGINIDTSYSSYNNLIQSGAYIEDANGNPFEGQVWPGYTIFPDFLNPDAEAYWENEIAQFLAQVPYDGKETVTDVDTDTDTNTDHRRIPQTAETDTDTDTATDTDTDTDAETDTDIADTRTDTHTADTLTDTHTELGKLRVS